MDEQLRQLLIFIGVILIGQVGLKLWSLFSIPFHKFNKDKFSNQHGLDELYFIIYGLLYFFHLGVVYVTLSITYKIGYYIFIILVLNITLTILIYQKINPELTQIVSHEKVILESKNLYKNENKKWVYVHYFLNTFYQISIVVNSIVAITVYVLLIS
ncbi:MAG: hypothetical protein ACOX56_06960 [Acholeplasmataceae bacterium]